MDDADAKSVLLDIRRAVAAVYPFKEGDVVDPRYAMALGLIAGTCVEAIQAVQQGRPMRINLKEPPGV